jgi:pimeloyl-ACP methyl ester carboxylesterase
MREYPDGIRSVILDSTRSVQSSETSTPGDIDRAFNKLFDGCAADPDCNRAFPNLREVFFKTVDRLNATPATGEATNPFNGDEYQIVVSGDDLIGLTIQGLYSTNIIAQLPKAIYAASTGADYNLLIRLALNSALQNEFVSYGMFYAVRCNEEVSFETPETLAAADDAFPQFRNLLDQSLYSTICTIWNAGTAPAVENQPVTSDIPTLILSGEYDPATPPDDGRAAAATLSNSYFFEFPGLGHGISAETECSLGISKAFLNDPTSKPDDSCVAQMGGPAFTGTGAAVKLKPITSSDGSFETVIPETWEEVGFGVYAENTSSSIALIMIAFPGNPEDTLDRIQSALSAEGDTDPDGEYKTDQLTWTLYDLTIQNQPGNVALAEGDGRTYVVILISDKVEQEALVKTIFNPVLDAFTPR